MKQRPKADEQLCRELPLPLAQLYRRAANAKTALERHQAAYYLWEASLKLLGTVAIVEFSNIFDRDPELVGRLENLARPSVGHWWEFVRRLVPLLAEDGDEHFTAVRDLLLGRMRDDMPRAAGLDATLREALEHEAGSRSTVRLIELQDRMVRYRNRELGHGAHGHRSSDFYDDMGRALLLGVSEMFSRVDPLAGRRLVYVDDVRHQASRTWLIERYELKGESAHRLESLELPESEVALLPRSKEVYLSTEDGAFHSLHPLVLHELETGEVFFLSARRNERRSEYLCYSTGRVIDRDDLGKAHQEFLGHVLGKPVDDAAVDAWSARSHAEDVPAGERPREAEPTGRRMGEYELLSKMGQGGMGVVYRAWQPSLGRTVALKCLLRTGDPKAEARFSREIRSLGRVEHPNLVKIFTSGSEGDQWFYAMELVEGADLASVCEKLGGSDASAVGEAEWKRALTTACEEARQKEVPVSPDPSGTPSATEALAPVAAEASRAAIARTHPGHIDQVVDLVRQVAEASHVLHEAGVLHRDIKPGNVMLTHDGSHAVLMDLGLAQLLDDADGRLTRTRQFVGTLRYASPEQVLAVGSIDRRSDVYSLGATLCELLTLQPLFGATDETPTPDLMQKIMRQDPERPRRLNPRIPADLEAIVLKCLMKEPENRYSTALDLGRDLERFQHGEPVWAQPPTLRYFMGKYVRRNRLKIGVAAAVFLFVVVGAVYAFYRINAAREDAVASGIVADRMREEAVTAKNDADRMRDEAVAAKEDADRQRTKATLEAKRAKAVSDFLVNVVGLADPDMANTPDVTIRDMLDSASMQVGKAFRNHPAAEAKLRTVIGRAYLTHYELEKARTHLERAVEIRRRINAMPEELYEALWPYSEVLVRLEEPGWSKPRNETLALGRTIIERSAPELATALEHFKKHLLKAGSITDKLEVVRRRAAAAELGDTLRLYLADQIYACGYRLFRNSGYAADACFVLQEALDLQRQQLKESHSRVVQTQGLLLDGYNKLWRYVEAEEQARKSLELLKQSGLRADHCLFALYRLRLGTSLAAQGYFDEGEQALKAGLPRIVEVFGKTSYYTLRALERLVKLYDKWGKPELAAAYRRDLAVAMAGAYDTTPLARMAPAFGPEHKPLFAALRRLRRKLGSGADAGPQIDAVLEMRRSLSIADNHPIAALVADLLTNQGMTYGNARGWQGQSYQQALAMFNEGVLVGDAASLRHPRRTGASHWGVAFCQAGLKQYARGELAARRALSLLRAAVGDDHTQTQRAMRELGVCLAGQGRYAEAEPLLLEAYYDFLAGHGTDYASTRASLRRVSNLYRGWGKPEKAIALLEEALRKAPRWPEAKRDLGTFLAAQGRHEEAEPLLLEAYESALADNGTDDNRTVAALRGVSNLYSDWEKPGKKLAFLNEAIRKAPGWYYPHHQLGFLWRNQGEYDKAYAAHLRSFELNSSWYWGHENCAWDAALQFRCDLALRHLEKALEIAPRNAELYRWAAIVYRRIGRQKEAIRQANKAVSLRGNAGDYSVLAEVHLNYGDHGEKPFASLETARARYPDRAGVYSRLAYIYLLRDDVPAALAAARKAVEELKGGNVAHGVYGRALHLSDRCDESLYHFQQCAQGWGGPPFSRWLGEAFIAAGRPDEARAIFEDQVKRWRQDPHARAALAWFLVATGGQDRRRGLAVAKEAVELSYSQGPVMLSTLAEAQFRNGMAKEAIATCGRLLKLMNGGNAEWLTLDEVKEQLQRYRSAPTGSR